MTIKERAFQLLQESYPSLNEGHFKIMKETLHPMWCQALAVATAEEEDCPDLADDGSINDH